MLKYFAIALLAALTFGQQPNNVQFTVRSVATGPWSDTATWDAGRVPATGDTVQVRAEHVVTYDVQSAEHIRMVHVAGTLKFATDRSTSLTVGLVKLQPGTEATEEIVACDQHPEAPPEGPGAALLEMGPQPVEHKATIRLKQWVGTNANGLPAIVNCGGRWEAHGAPMSRTWVKLGKNAKVGDLTVTLSEPVTGWGPGDRLYLTPSTKQADGEEKTLALVNGLVLTLSAPLTGPHAGTLPMRAEVANLSRNIVVESADPLGARGHTMFHRGSSGSLSYVELRDLGKEGVLGRYPVHFHLVGTTMEGSTFTGLSILRSKNRFMAIHGTDGLTVRDCVGYDAVGNGFFLEDGTEQYNVLDRNLAIRVRDGNKLPGQALPYDPNNGVGFWFANANNTFTRNVATQNERSGFQFHMAAEDGFNPVLLLRDRETPVDVRTLPFRKFEDNESHNDLFYGFWFGDDTNHVPGTTGTFEVPFVAKNLKAWRINYGLRNHIRYSLMDGVWIGYANYGIYHCSYNNQVYRNVYLKEDGPEWFNRGHDDHDTQDGMTVVLGLTIDGYKPSATRPPSDPLLQLASHSATAGTALHIVGLTFVNSNITYGRIVDLGEGGRHPNPQFGVTYYLHDWYGPGRCAEVVRAWDAPSGYTSQPPLTGPETRAREIPNPTVPQLLGGQ